jgi:hypothetical protein
MRRQYYVKSSCCSLDSENAGHKAAATKKEHDSSSKVPDPFESERERDDALHNIRSYLWLKDFESNVKQGEGYFPFLSQLLVAASDAKSVEDDWKVLAKVNLKHFFSVSYSDEIEANQNPKPHLTTASRGSGLKQMTGLSSKEISRVKNSSPDSVTQIEKVEKEGSVLTKAAEKVSDHFSEYNDEVNYGDMYSCLLESLEKSFSKNLSDDTRIKGEIAKAIYHNLAQILMLREAGGVKDLAKSVEAESKSSGIKQNHYTPKGQDAYFRRGEKNFLGGRLLYQRQTNMPVSLEYLKKLLCLSDSNLPTLLRFVMQVMRIETGGGHPRFFDQKFSRESRVNSIFKAYTDGLKEGEIHLYLNFLDTNKTKYGVFYSENDMLDKLSAFAKDCNSVLLVSLPSTQGSLGIEAPSDKKIKSKSKFISKLNETLCEHNSTEMNFDIRKLSSDLLTQFTPSSRSSASSEKTEQDLAEHGPSYEDLITQSIEFIVGKDKSEFTQAQMQAIEFHLYSHAIPKAILNFYESQSREKKIASMNFSCKSGIDRGWKAQLYFLIAEYVHMQSRSEGKAQPSTEEIAEAVKAQQVSTTILRFIEDFLDSAAYAARGREMNPKNRAVFFNVIEVMATSGKLRELLGDCCESFIESLRDLREIKNLCDHNSSKPETSLCTIT